LRICGRGERGYTKRGIGLRGSRIGPKNPCISGEKEDLGGKKDFEKIQRTKKGDIPCLSIFN